MDAHDFDAKCYITHKNDQNKNSIFFLRKPLEGC